MGVCWRLLSHSEEKLQAIQSLEGPLQHSPTLTIKVTHTHTHTPTHVKQGAEACVSLCGVSGVGGAWCDGQGPLRRALVPLRQPQHR